GFAYQTLADGTELGFVDVPGHERFLPNMLAGVLGIDRVLLIVAADDGPRPQTLEHLDILALIGVAEVTGVVTKIDRVDAARRAAVAAEVAALLAGAGYPGAPVLAVSSRTGEGVAALAAHLREAAVAADRARAARPPAGLFRLAIDRVFSLPGIGLVVTGTAASGSVAPGDRLLAGAHGTEVRVRGVHAHNRPVERAGAGERCALNMAGGFAAGREPHRGDWVLAPPLHAPTSRLDLAVRVSAAAPAPLRDGLPVHLHLGTADIVARVAVLGARAIAPGDSGFVQLDLREPVGALWGDRAVLRDHAARHTLAGGRVLDPFPPRRGRARPERLAWLEAQREPDPAAALARLVEIAGTVELAPFALARNLAPGELDAVLAGGGFRRRGSARCARRGYRRRAGRLAPRPARCPRPLPRRPAARSAGAGGGARRRAGGADRGRQGGPRGRRAAPARAPAAPCPRRRAAVGAGGAAARRRRAAPAAGARAGRGTRARPRSGAAVSETGRAFRPGRPGRAQPLLPAGDGGAARRHRRQPRRRGRRRPLYRRRVQGPLRGRPQPGDRGAGASRCDRRHPPCRRRPHRAARRRGGVRLGEGEEAAVAGDRGGDAGKAQRVPHHCQVAGDDRLAELAFEPVEHRQGRHPGAAEEHRLGLRPVDRAGQRGGALGGLVVDVGDAFQVVGINHLKPPGFEMRLAGGGGLG